jgi:hypothetical protein
VPAVVLGGIGCLLTVGTIGLFFPAIRRFGSLHEARPIEEKPESHGFPVINPSAPKS